MLSCILDTMLSIHREVTTIGIHVEHNHINLRRCLKKFDPKDDDEDD